MCRSIGVGENQCLLHWRAENTKIGHSDKRQSARVYLFIPFRWKKYFNDLEQSFRPCGGNWAHPIILEGPDYFSICAGKRNFLWLSRTASPVTSHVKKYYKAKLYFRFERTLCVHTCNVPILTLLPGALPFVNRNCYFVRFCLLEGHFQMHTD